MTAQPPGSQLIWIAAARSNILRLNSVWNKVAQVRCVELHRTNVVGAIGVGHPLTGLARFFLCYGEHDVCGDFVLDRGGNRADDAFMNLLRREWTPTRPPASLPILQIEC